MMVLPHQCRLMKHIKRLFETQEQKFDQKLATQTKQLQQSLTKFDLTVGMLFENVARTYISKEGESATASKEDGKRA